jgi:hypothetical protein
MVFIKNVVFNLELFIATKTTVATILASGIAFIFSMAWEQSIPPLEGITPKELQVQDSLRTLRADQALAAQKVELTLQEIQNPNTLEEPSEYLKDFEEREARLSEKIEKEKKLLETVRKSSAKNDKWVRKSQKTLSNITSATLGCMVIFWVAGTIVELWK